MALRRLAWLVPFAYGLVLTLASLAWLITGEPFDQATYERIGRASWADLTAAAPPGLLDVLAATVRLQGGNSALLAGLLAMMFAAVPLRRSEPWARAAALLLPLHALLDLVLVARLGGLASAVLAWDLGLAALLLAALAVRAPQAG